MAKDKKIVIKPVSPPASSSGSEASSSEESDQEQIASSLQKGKGKAVQNLRPQDVRKYRAPSGMKAIRGVDKVSLDFKELEDDPTLELWAIRIPTGVKAKYLEGVTIQLSKDSSKKNGAIGAFSNKKNDFEIFLADPAPTKKRSREDEEASNSRGGGEMHSLVPLVPNHSKQDILFQTRPLTKHLLIQRALPPSVLSHLPSSTSSLITSLSPSAVPGAILSAEELLQPEIVQQKKKIRAQPRLLKMGIKLGGMRGEGGKGLFDNKPVPKVFVEEYQEEGEEEEGDGMEVDEEADVVVEEEVVVEKKVKKEKKEKSEKKEKKEKVKK